jgi:hypothetical protein
MTAHADSIHEPFVPGTLAPRTFLVPLICAIAMVAGAGPSSLRPEADTGSASQPASARHTALPEGAAVAAKWATPPLIARPQTASEERADPSQLPAGPGFDSDEAVLLAGGSVLLLAISLLESIMFTILHLSARRRRMEPVSKGPRSEVDYEARCRQQFLSVQALWNGAETAVFDLNESLPLRTLLFNEMKQISKRLSTDPSAQPITTGAVTVFESQPYWRTLSQRLNQSVRDLDRIRAVAEAAGAGFGSRHSEPRIPKTRDEACFILGANRNVTAETLQRLVKALRQCWHPDLAQTDDDRRYREARLKQINAAHDLITGKRVEG